MDTDMKKFMKGCGITALVLLVLGFALAMIAGSTRGSIVVAQVVEEATGGKLHANFSFGTPVWGIFWDNNWWKKVDKVHFELDMSDAFDRYHDIIDGDILNNADLLNGEYSFEADAVKSLDIEVGGCAFETKASENGLYYLKAKGIGKIQFYLEDDELHIIAVNTKAGLNSLTNISWTGSITLYVPEGCTYDEVNIEMGAGELLFDDLVADEIYLEVGAGHIQVNNVKARKLEASAGLGQLELYDMDVEKLNAEVGMGELVAHGNISKSGSLECAMGNLDIKLDGSERDFNYQLEAAAGNIDIGHSSYSGLARERKINNNASKNLEVECSMGNISIRFTE